MLTFEVPNLVRCYGLTKEPENGNYMMVLNYAVDGDLKNFLENKKDYFTWKERYSLLCDISLALLKIHERNIIHRDLHPGNILITGNSWVISDLGISKFSDDKSKSEIIGVLPYIAPEVLLSFDYTTAVDIYSIGIIMWQIVYNCAPYWNRNHDISLVRDIYDGLRPPKISGLHIDYEEMMERCWNTVASNRPSALELFEFSKKNYQRICSGEIFIPEMKINSINESYNNDLKPRIINTAKIKDTIHYIQSHESDLLIPVEKL
ncbi:kinase-like domain-containing protein [Gigaspora rosea]|uniref:Kinase-like domain-containing protein n=1 Tax=Gigaspora rosea TaxID=44941 RepID=A0A397VZI9_9GLOM|nr:kinase-like domain-containing protein [Gigaspora rosea]